MPDTVDAVLNFVAPDPSRHATSFSRDEAHAREPERQLEKVLQDGGIRPEHVTVRDARGADGPGGEGSLQDELLNGCGFVLLRQHTAVTDWMDEEHVAEHFYRECVELAQRCLPGATVLALDDHDLRKEEAPGWDGEAPATFAHNDFADNMGERLVAQFPEARGAFEGHRLVTLNMWRNVSPTPVERLPLALCDRRTVRRADLQAFPLPGEILSDVLASAHEPGQEWWYFSQMTREEVLVFLTFDSEPHGGAFLPTLCAS